MEITHTTDILVETKRRFIIRQPQTEERIVCPNCGELMLTIERTAVLLSVSQLAVFRLIETSAAHFIETGAGVLFVCPNSLAENPDKQK